MIERKLVVLWMENRNFANMNGASFYILLLCFVSGITQCALMGIGVFMLKYHRTYQFQRVYAAVLLLHSIGFFNNFVILACQNLPYSEFLNLLLLFFDFLIAGGYMMFGVSLVFPNRFKIHQLLLLEIPFVIAMLLFAITQNSMVLPIVRIYTLVASIALLVCLKLSIKKHTKMLLDNVGNLEHFDLRWTNYLLAVYFVVLLIWTVESFSQQTWFSAQSMSVNLFFDTVYCFFIIVIVLLVVMKLNRQKVFTLSTTEAENVTENQEIEAQNSVANPQYHKALINNNLENVIVENRYYQDNTLTLQKLAQLLGTNRQYLSNYINQEKHESFYVYINDFRLEEAKRLLDSKNEENHHSVEEISLMSGFNSYITFLRSFKKKYGQTPLQYLSNRK